MRRSTVITGIRWFIGIVFIVYGVVKLAGGQFYYGDWVIDKKTVGGPFLVWAFHGYSPIYGRFLGLFEFVPGLLMLIPRTATVGAAALFAVSLNITVMDFTYGFPGVKYAALLYTVLIAMLLWFDRQKLLLLVASNDRLRAVIPDLPEHAPANPRMRSVLIAAGALFVLFAANVVATSLSEGPETKARLAAASRAPAGATVAFLRSRYIGQLINRTAIVDFLVTGGGSTDTLRIRARKATGFTPWQIEDAAEPKQ